MQASRVVKLLAQASWAVAQLLILRRCRDYSGAGPDSVLSFEGQVFGTRGLEGSSVTADGGRCGSLLTAIA